MCVSHYHSHRRAPCPARVRSSRPSSQILIQVSTVPFSFGGAGRTVLNVISSEGAFGLWRGHGATLLRILPYAGLHYASHEAIEDGFRWRQGLPHGAPLGPAERFVAGAVAGGAATLATYPLDVVRARMAVAGPGARLSKATLDVLRAGPAVSFRGVLPTLLVRGSLRACRALEQTQPSANT